MKKTGIGIVGCGNISGIYFKNLCDVFRNVEVKACADLVVERAETKANAYPDVRISTLDEILASPDIDIIESETPGSAGEILDV